MPAKFPQTIQKNPIVRLDDSTGNTPQTLVSAGENGSKIYSITAYNADTEIHTLIITIGNPTATGILGTIVIPAGQSANVLNVEDLPALAADGTFIIGPNCSLKVGTSDLPTTGRFVDVIAEVSDY